jgi:alpha-glucosidase
VLLLLALPGPAFVYQGQELGLEEADLPDEVREDPIFHRTKGERIGRDGCRVPIPWTRELQANTWLPQPADWSEKSVEAQLGRDGSFLELYRRALALRPSGEFAWRDAPDGVLAFDRGDLTCVVRFGDAELDVEGEVVLATDDAAWIRR